MDGIYVNYIKQKIYLLGESFQKDHTSNHFHQSSEEEVKETVTSK